MKDLAASPFPAPSIRILAYELLRVDDGTGQQTYVSPELFEDAGNQNVGTRLEKELNLDQQVALLKEQLEDQEKRHQRNLANSEQDAKEHCEAWIRGESARSEAESRSRVQLVIERLEEMRCSYLKQVEGEVIELALSIAERVLQYEARIDRLFLAGAVRVALDRMDENTAAVLRVPESDATDWEKFIRNHGKGGARVEVHADCNLKTGDCICEMGATKIDIGVKRQLLEIEHSFGRIVQRKTEQLVSLGKES